MFEILTIFINLIFFLRNYDVINILLDEDR